LKAILGDDALDAAHTDGIAQLPQLLGHDLGRGFSIEEQVADDLAHDLLGSSVVVLRARLVILKCHRPAGMELLQQLVVALAGVTELAHHGGDVRRFALSLEEHGELLGDFIVLPHRQLSRFPDEHRLLILECEHGVPPGSSVSRGGIAWRNDRPVSIRIWRIIRGMTAVDMPFLDAIGTYQADDPTNCAIFGFTLSESKPLQQDPDVHETVRICPLASRLQTRFPVQMNTLSNQQVLKNLCRQAVPRWQDSYE
jgi:hypothetical protein